MSCPLLGIFKWDGNSLRGGFLAQRAALISYLGRVPPSRQAGRGFSPQGRASRLPAEWAAHTPCLPGPPHPLGARCCSSSSTFRLCVCQSPRRGPTRTAACGGEGSPSCLVDRWPQNTLENCGTPPQSPPPRSPTGSHPLLEICATPRHPSPAPTARPAPGPLLCLRLQQCHVGKGGAG